MPVLFALTQSLAAGLVGQSLLAAQTGVAGKPKTAQNPLQKPATLKTTTRLVQVNAVVQDKNGQPVDGLTKGDFTLLDQGKPQTIATFSQERGGLRPAFVKTLPPNVFTNRFDQTGQAPGSVTILLFDALNTPRVDQTYARQQLVKFLHQVQPQDHIAIYLLTTRLKVLLEFTQDTGALRRAVGKLQGFPSPELDGTTGTVDSSTDSITPQLEELLNWADGQIGDFYTINRAETTAAALVAIAHHVAHVPGRKSVVWVSGSFPIAIGMDGETLAPPNREVRAFTPEIERATRALNDANMAIYPVDARGLIGPFQFSAANRNAPDIRQPQRLGPDQNNFATMNTLAERTGGHAFYNTNDIEGSVRKAVSDGQSNYELAYYPNHGKWDGKFHEIKVKVRRPGLQVHYRRGYFASADVPSNAAERKASLDTAVISPIDATNLSIYASVIRLPEPSTGELQFKTWLDLHEIMFQESGGRQNGNLEVILVQKDANTKVLDTDSKNLEFSFEPERYQALLKSGMTLIRNLPMKAGATQVRIIVRDSLSGATGSVLVPLKSFFQN